MPESTCLCYTCHMVRNAAVRCAMLPRAVAACRKVLDSYETWATSRHSMLYQAVVRHIMFHFPTHSAFLLCYFTLTLFARPEVIA